MKYYSYSLPDEEAKKELVMQGETTFRAELEAAAEFLLSRELKFIALSGPTCSGKTTTATTLIKKLEETGKNVKVISIDDFFLERDILIENSKKSGKPIDLDSVNAIDLDELRGFVDGIELLLPQRLPSFDFTTGKRAGYTEIVPTEKDIFIFEGIQAVYPEVVALFEPRHLVKVYISVEKGIYSPFGSLLPREIRLMRRIVRDARTRNTDAETTFEHWSGVAANEISSIEPYREGCDVKINSGMAYEICVLKKPLISLLEKIKEDSLYYIKAKMLIELLDEFPEISASYVPSDSVLREFIG
ncbi:MAG: hypothetical protein IJO00_03470 [Clostridia bacterium]|nr:hypothetical protein [Clostridia bacterium]